MFPRHIINHWNDKPTHALNFWNLPPASHSRRSSDTHTWYDTRPDNDAERHAPQRRADRGQKTSVPQSRCTCNKRWIWLQNSKRWSDLTDGTLTDKLLKLPEASNDWKFYRNSVCIYFILRVFRRAGNDKSGDFLHVTIKTTRLSLGKTGLVMVTISKHYVT